jgi:hypothetical protein
VIASLNGTGLGAGYAFVASEFALSDGRTAVLLPPAIPDPKPLLILIQPGIESIDRFTLNSL